MLVHNLVSLQVMLFRPVRCTLLFMIVLSVVPSCVDRSFGVCAGARESARQIAAVAKRYDLGTPICTHGEDLVRVSEEDPEVYRRTIDRLKADGWTRAPQGNNPRLVTLKSPEFPGVTAEFRADINGVEIRYR